MTNDEMVRADAAISGGEIVIARFRNGRKNVKRRALCLTCS